MVDNMAGDSDKKVSTESVLSYLSSNNTEFVEMQHKFDEVIEELPGYGPTLARIKKQYETVVNIATDNDRVKALVALEESRKASDEMTVRNLCKRKAELETKIIKLESENKRLKNEVEIIRDISSMRRKEKERRASPYHKRFPISSGKRMSLGMALEEAIDIKFLGRELDRMKLVLENIQYNTEKRYVPKAQKETLQHQLMTKDKEKEKLERNNRYLCHLYLQLCEYYKEAKKYYNSIKDQDPSAYPPGSFCNYLLRSSRQITTDDILNTLDSLAQEDPDEEKEAEFILHCCQRFNELFDCEQYYEAAVLAATSPKGVLRNMVTLNKFKSVESLGHIHSPMMLYCSALMDTASVYPPVTPEEAMECVKCALDNKEIDMIAKWISNDSLPLTRDIGVYLYTQCNCTGNCTCQCCLLALVIFKKLNCHFETLLCFAKLGQYNNMLLLAKDHTKDDIASLLSTVPSIELALFLINPPSNKPILHLFEVLYILTQAKNSPIELCTQLIQSYAVMKRTPWQDVIRQEIRLRPDLVASLIPVLAQYPQLDHLVTQLYASNLVQNILNKVTTDIIIEEGQRNINTMSSTSSTSNHVTNSTSSFKGSSQLTTPSSSRRKLTRSQRFDDDDGDESCDSRRSGQNESTCTSTVSDSD